jgi:hypothetical protein
MNLIERAKEALEVATPGKRVQFHGYYCKEAESTPFTDWDTSHETSVILPDGSRYRGYSNHKHAADAALDALAHDLASLAVAAGELADVIWKTVYRVDHTGVTTLTGVDAMMPINAAIAEGKE